MNPAELHPLLLRQLRRLGVGELQRPASAKEWLSLLQRVSSAYREADQDRYLLERSQEISSRELTEQAQALRLNEARLSSLLSLSSDWVWEIDAERRFVYLSEGWRAATGVEPSEMVGRKLRELPGIDLAAEALPRVRELMAAREPFRDFTFGIAKPDGGRHFVRVSGEPMRDGAGQFQGYRGVGSDVTAETLAAQQAEQMARYDSLTGLANRALLREALKRALARAVRHDARVALMFIDLDGFKYINDNLGHAAGDELLQVMAGRLGGVVRSSDLVARLGGDEFVLLIDEAGDRAALTAVARRVLDLIAEPVRLEGRVFELTGSLGISVFPDDADAAANLLRHADAAMYVAKEQGKNGFCFYSADLAARGAELFALESDLRGAVERGELELHYQPKYRLDNGALTGVEALVRWRHPQRGLVSPADFIPLAETRGLILPIGRWVLDAACDQMRAWRDAGVAVPHCAINLSAQHFATDGIVEDLQAALRRRALSSDALEIEITESMVMSDPVRAQRVLEKLAGMGVRIAIDDFGTGYSSLNYLKRFPAEALKIDRSFVRGLPGDSNDAAITRAVVAMAHSLGMQVVAEGVETAAQLAFLRELRCDQAQGFLLGRPSPAQLLEVAVAPLALARRA